jgi:HAD superfamily hydrolase (TIGR01490 family)
MKLALFDLDKTLLPVESADNWLHFVIDRCGLDDAGRRAYRARIRHFADSYEAGAFDVDAYLELHFEILARFPRPRLELWRARYLAGFIFPNIRIEALQLVDRFRRDGYSTVLITGTSSFISRPIAAALGLDHLLAVEPEQIDGRYTGRRAGAHTHMEGKVVAVEEFLRARGLTLARCEDSVFHSDSINDLPLLSRVKRPVATNPDARLRALAREKRWPVLDLFDAAAPDAVTAASVAIAASAAIAE